MKMVNEIKPGDTRHPYEYYAAVTVQFDLEAFQNGT